MWARHGCGAEGGAHQPLLGPWSPSAPRRPGGTSGGGGGWGRLWCRRGARSAAGLEVPGAPDSKGEKAGSACSQNQQCLQAAGASLPAPPEPPPPRRRPSLSGGGPPRESARRSWAPRAAGRSLASPGRHAAVPLVCSFLFRCGLWAGTGGHAGPGRSRSRGPALLLLASGTQGPARPPHSARLRARGAACLESPRHALRRLLGPGRGLGPDRRARSRRTAVRQAFGVARRGPPVGLWHAPPFLRSSPTRCCLYSAHCASVRFPMPPGVSVTCRVGRSFLGNSAMRFTCVFLCRVLDTPGQIFPHRTLVLPLGGGDTWRPPVRGCVWASGP